MMRPITCLSLMVALGAGLYLYQVKHRAQLLDQNINRTVKLADATRERIGLLKAEWALLEDPQRLQDLATHHLQLQPLAPGQFVRLEDLAARLPAVIVPAAPAEPPVAAAAPKVETVVAQVAPVLPPATPVTDAPEPAKPAPVRPAPPRPARPTVMASLAKPAHPLYAPVMPAYEPSSLGVHAPTVQTASATVPAAPPPAPFVGSALGMARTGMAPPAPVPQAGGLAGGGALGYPGAR